MELRHLRCFLAAAEELRFAHAVEKPHIGQSPLSRAIDEPEENLGARLFIRNSRGTRLSRAGQVVKEHVSRTFTASLQAREGARAGAAGYDGHLRIALSSGIAPPRRKAPHTISSSNFLIRRLYLAFRSPAKYGAEVIVE